MGVETMDDARRESITRALAQLASLATVDRQGEAAMLAVVISGEIAALAVDAYSRGRQDGAPSLLTLTMSRSPTRQLKAAPRPNRP
jgi:hypothetical protein